MGDGITGLAACSAKAGRVDLFARAASGAVLHSTYERGWSDWSWVCWGNAPAVVCPRTGRIELFVVGWPPRQPLQRVVFEETEDGSWSRSDQETLGHFFTGPQAPESVRPDELRLAVAAPDEQIRDAFLMTTEDPWNSVWHLRVGEPVAEFAQVLAVTDVAAASYAPGTVDLVATSFSQMHRRLAGAWTMESFAGPPVFAPPTHWRPQSAALSGQGELFVAGTMILYQEYSRRDSQVWRRPLAGGGSWEPLGGAVGRHLAIATQDDGRTDVFGVQGGSALVHTSFDGAWQDWEVLDVWTPDGRYDIVRPQDFAALLVQVVSMRQDVGPDGATVLLGEGSLARLIVELPPQHVAEEYSDHDTWLADTRLAGPSRLVFAVADQDTIPLTVDGVLDAMARLPVVVADAARAPRGNETAIEMPWRLVLSPQEGIRAEHPALPVAGPDGTTEVWHSRLAGPGPAGELSVRAAAEADVPGEYSDHDTWLADARAFPYPLHGWLEAILAHQSASETPVEVRRLILSGYGGWLSAHATWPNADLGDLEWDHASAMGRDYDVRLALAGVLFPFGHRAVLVETWHRNFDRDAAMALLEKTRTIVITEPVRQYQAGEGGLHERRFPFQRVAIEPLVVGPLDGSADGEPVPGSPEHRYLWPSRHGATIEFSVHARAGSEEVELRLPLLFTTERQAAQTLDGIYAAGPTTSAFADVAGLGDEAAARRFARSPAGGLSRPTSFIGRQIPLAMKTSTEALEGAVHEVHSMTFGGRAIPAVGGAAGFHPEVTQLEVKLPAMRQLLGTDDPLLATFHRELLDAVPGAEPDKLLTLASPLKVPFSEHLGNVGGLASPDFVAKQVSRAQGPLPDLPALTPETLFDETAKLLGMVKLRDVVALADVALADRPPKLVWSTSGPMPTATLAWRAPLKSVGPLRAHGTVVDLHVTAELGPDQRPSVTTTGVINDFSLSLLLVELRFRSLRFAALPGRRPTVEVNLRSAELLGPLEFVKRLQELIPTGGAGLPSVDTSGDEVTVSYRTGLASLALGPAFSLQNLNLATVLHVPLRDAPVSIDFSFGTRERPFQLTVSMFGGGGYLELSLNADGLQRLIGALEFGASVSMDFVVASGEVHVWGGIVFAKLGDTVHLTGYLRIGGSVSVLGFIRISVELNVSLEYVAAPRNELVGSARLVIAVDLTFWSDSVELECHKRFAGSDLSPPPAAPGAGTLPSPRPAPDLPFPDTLLALRNDVSASAAGALEPGDDADPWAIYSHAFATEGGHA